jgi:hypothetical protein
LVWILEDGTEEGCDVDDDIEESTREKPNDAQAAALTFEK